MNEHASPRGVIVGESDNMVTLGFSNGVTTTMRRGSLDLPQPTGVHIETATTGRPETKKISS